MQTHDIKRTILQRFDVPGSKYETVIAVSRLGPNENAIRESHPGIESGYVLEGSGTILPDGEASIELHPGAAYKLKPSAVHTVKSGPKGVKIVAVWALEKGKPLATPAA